MKKLLFLLSVVAGGFGCGAVQAPASPVAFQAAESVWPQGLENEMNELIGFSASFEAKKGEAPILRMAGWYSYRVTLNGIFIGFGPARGPKGFFRPDEWPLAAAVKDGTNILLVEVAGYNVPNFYLMQQPPFLQAEVVLKDRVLAKTGVGGDFTARRQPRVKKAVRLSFQRTFAEAYRLPGPEAPVLPLAAAPVPVLIPRRAPYPAFEYNPRLTPLSRARVRLDLKKNLHIDRALSLPSQKGPFKGYSLDEVEVNNAFLGQQLVSTDRRPLSSAERKATHFALKGGESVLFDQGFNDTGFPGTVVTVKTPGRLLASFDEVLVNGEARGVDRFRDLSYTLVWDFEKPGTYAIDAFEPYTLRYLDLAVLSGEMDVAVPHFRSYKNPTAAAASLKCSDCDLEHIFAAAAETFRQNAVDVFMDCPSRERAGWNCDAYFTGAVSTLLTGSPVLEQVFEENIALPPAFDNMPDGMIPMCYPSDHRDNSYIPNWAMWFVLETDEYLRRSGDRATIDALRPRLEKLVKFLWTFRNSDGLLEKLPSWVFVEWSRANKLVQDVNYPSNMTWADVLDAMSRLYARPDLAAEATKVRETVRRQSWTGKWFCDNAVRQKDGTLKLSGECTETCQYYAFFHRVATPESHPALWHTLLTDFGPQRYDPKDRSKLLKYPEIWPSNAFIGNYLRLKLLERMGLGQQILRETKGYFKYMADRTGTLWENDTTCASCNHGFASYAAVLLVHSVVGAEVDLPRKTLTLHKTDAALDFCELTLPAGEAKITVTRVLNGDGTVSLAAYVPEGWKVEGEPARVFTRTGDWGLAVSYAGKTASFTFNGPDALSVSHEEMVLKTKDPAAYPWTRAGDDPKYWGWCAGTRFEKIRACECTTRFALVPQSVVLTKRDGTRLVAGRDYELEPTWGAVARLASGRIAEGETVLAQYAYGRQRLDRIVLNRAQRLVLKRGAPDVAYPEPPELDEGEVSVATVWVDAHAKALVPDCIFPTFETAFPKSVKAPKAAEFLPKTLAKLEKGEPVKILAWGDSVTNGSYLPEAERWQGQFVRRLQAQYPKAPITLVSNGWGGKSSGSFLAAPETDKAHHYPTSVLGVKPDLVVIEFVNDCGLSRETLNARYGKILSDFRAQGTEVCILTPHYVRGDWMGFSSQKNCDLDPRPYVSYVRDFCAANHVPCADASRRWGRLWRMGIPYKTLLVNDINHPNAYGMGLFADVLMEMFR